MRPQKLTTPQILQRCALQFKIHGYASTSMEMLAKACGLTKAAFYYHFPNKEALLLEVLQHTHQYLKKYLFQIELSGNTQIVMRFEQMHQRAVEFFSTEVCGCLIGIISLEAANISFEVYEKIQHIFHDWQTAFYQLFSQKLDTTQAQTLAKISVADYEGAILMYRFNQDCFYLEQVKQRILKQIAL